MKYYNEDNNEISKDDIDLEKGYTHVETRVLKHHDAVPYKEGEGHTYPETYYFDDGTSYKTTGEDDPHIVQIDETHWDYKNLDSENKTVFGIDLAYVVDVPEQEAQAEWDETEDVTVYHKYTQEQLEHQAEAKAKQESMDVFFADNSGPERLDNAELTIDDLAVILADIIAG